MATLTQYEIAAARGICSLSAAEVRALIAALGSMCRGGKSTCPPCELAKAVGALRPVDTSQGAPKETDR
jgi:hypothetical protein